MASMSDTSTPSMPTPEDLYQQIAAGLDAKWNPEGVEVPVDDTVVPAPPTQDPTDASVSPGADPGGDGSATSVTPPGPELDDAPAEGGFTDPDNQVVLPDPDSGIVPDGGPLSPPGQAAGSDGSPPPDLAAAQPSADQQAQAAVDATAMITDYLGRAPTVDEVAYLIGVGAQLGQLSQEQSAAIAAIMNGQPAAQFTHLQSPPPQQAAPPAASNAGVEDPFAEPPDPQVAQLAAEVAAMKAQQEQAQWNQQQQWAAQQMAVGRDDFAAAAPYPMTDAEVAILEIKARDSGIYQANVQRGVDPRTAWRTALEQSLWADPIYRQRVIDAQTATAAEQNATDQARQAAASSVRGGGGMSPLTSATAQGPMTREEHLAAATDEARVAMNGGQSG